jgi:hypothetical protein
MLDGAVNGAITKIGIKWMNEAFANNGSSKHVFEK